MSSKHVDSSPIAFQSIRVSFYRKLQLHLLRFHHAHQVHSDWETRYNHRVQRKSQTILQNRPANGSINCACFSVEAGHWLNLALEERLSNRRTIGSRIILQRFVAVGVDLYYDLKQNG